MQQIRKAVNNRYIGILRQIYYILMIICPDHYGINITRECSGRIGNGFAAFELHVVSTKKESMPSKLTDAGLKGNPRSG